MSDIFEMQVVEYTEELLDYGPAGVLGEPPVVGLRLLRFQVRVQRLTRYVLHHQVHALSRHRAVDALIQTDYLGMIKFA